MSVANAMTERGYTAGLSCKRTAQVLANAGGENNEGAPLSGVSGTGTNNDVRRNAGRSRAFSVFAGALGSSANVSEPSGSRGWSHKQRLQRCYTKAFLPKLSQIPVSIPQPVGRGDHLAGDQDPD
jgi:hypothetical protein